MLQNWLKSGILKYLYDLLLDLLGLSFHFAFQYILGKGYHFAR